MNITGSVILGLFYLLPGILFVFGLTRHFSTKTPSPFDGQLSFGFALSLPAALAMHVIGIATSLIVSWGLDTPRPDIPSALTLLLGDTRSPEVFAAINAAGQHWYWVAAYLCFVIVISYPLGKLTSRGVKQNRRADWYDLLRQEADMLWLTTDVQIGGTAYLFAGMLKDFKVSADGELERVVLLGAVRRTLKRPSDAEMDSGDENYQDGGWVPIPGEYVVLRMTDSHTINVDYWYLEKELADNGIPQGPQISPPAIPET